MKRLLLAAFFVLPWTALAENPCDLLFADGRIVDGTGAPWFRGDVCVVGDRIDAIGQLGARAAKRRIDASSLVVAPGFIDLLGQSEYSVLVDPRAASKITQGITTELTGEGGSIAPTDERQIAEGEDTWKRYAGPVTGPEAFAQRRIDSVPTRSVDPPPSPRPDSLWRIVCGCPIRRVA